VVDRVLARPRVAFTPRSRTLKRQILSELRRVRETGYAECLDELDPGVSSYACPVHIRGGVLYSVGVVGLSQRLGRVPTSELVAALREAAAELGERLSGSRA
jgi:DNA-binding IclR family transcriptional regulator